MTDRTPRPLPLLDTTSEWELVDPETLTAAVISRTAALGYLWDRQHALLFERLGVSVPRWCRWCQPTRPAGPTLLVEIPGSGGIRYCPRCDTHRRG